MNYRPNFNLAAFDSLESQQKRLSLLCKTAEIGEWSYVFSTDFTVWSDYLYDFYELDKDFECAELLQSTQLYQGSEKEKMQTLIAHVTATKKERSDDFMIVMQDGRVKWHTTTIHPILDAYSEITGLYGILQNITARKNSELDLQRMAYVAEKTNGIVMITDPEKKIIWINNSFEEILGYRSEEVIGLDPAAFLQGEETSAETIREIARSLRSSGTFSGEILNYTKSGEKIWLYLNIAAVY
ncbi:MAG: PAS domain S-box protein, partial [Nitrosomonadaceae bacterium]|nr:PAS domain S-box protein [Nitrosomonadaceae bacterium]